MFRGECHRYVAHSRNLLKSSSFSIRPEVCDANQQASEVNGSPRCSALFR